MKVRMPHLQALLGASALLAPLAAIEAAAPQTARGALSVSATVVPACSVGMRTTSAIRAQGNRSSPSLRQMVDMTCSGSEPTVELVRIQLSPSAESGTAYLTLTY